MAKVINAEMLVDGQAEGKILATSQTISFWGGVEPATGQIVDPRHELFGECITGKVLVFRYGKGSAAAPLVLLELAKQQTGPAAIVNVHVDPLLVAGPIISNHYYHMKTPVARITKSDFPKLQKGKHCVVDGMKETLVVND